MSASFTGMPLNEARYVFMDLKAEGENAPDPSQDEVVEFLTDQEFHVRHADLVPPSRKTQILGQLRAALKRAWKGILPDGPTFHAWKNVMSECWARAKKKTAATFLLGGMVAASLTGCGGTQALASQDATPTPTTTTISAAVTPATTLAVHQRTTLTTADTQFTTNTASGKGLTATQLRDANAAYKTAILFTMNNGMNGPTLTKTGPVTDADLATAKASMTPSAYKDLKAYATKANAGDAASVNEVFVFVSKDLINGSGFTYRAGDKPVLVKETFSSSPATTMDKTTVWLKFKVSADYQLLNAKKEPITATVKRDVSYSMERSKTGWLISGWTVKQTGAAITAG